MVTILRLRKATHLSQGKFADLLNIPVANVQKWEQGVSNPTTYVVKLIQSYLEQQNLVKPGDLEET